MKVLVVTSNMIKSRDGKLYCIQNLYDILNRFAKLGELYLCATDFDSSPKSSNLAIDANLDDLIPESNFYPLNYGLTKFQRNFLSSEKKEKIRKAVGDADFIIGYVPSTVGTYALAYATSIGKKTLSYVVACCWDSLWNYDWKGKILAPFIYLKTRRVISKSDYALYVTKEFLQRRYPNAGLACGCSDVSINEPESDLRTKRIEFLENSDLSNTFNIVTTGAVHVPYKGQKYVIEALGQLKKEGYNNFHYYLIGGGSNNRLKKIVVRLGIAENVHFLGIIPHANVEKVLAKMHVYIQPSMQEGLPRSLVEGMSQGLLAIGTPTGGIPELVKTEYTVRKRSSKDIARLLKSITKENLMQEVNYSLEKASEYTEENLDKRRNSFFEEIKESL